MSSAEERLWARIDRIENRTATVQDAIEAFQLIESHPLHAPSAVLQVTGVKGFVPSPSRSERCLKEMFLLAMSAIQVGKQRIYEWNVRKLASSVPRHQKVVALVGMKAERDGDTARAIQTYAASLERDPSALMLYKRQVALLKGQRLLQEAIATLNHYLTLYMADPNAWAELADLYLNASDYSKALFCVSECMLQSPQNWAFCVRAAEIYYTLGGQDNLLKARHYYSKSLVMNPKYNLRGLYGLWITCISLREFRTAKGSSKSQNDELLQFAKKRLDEHASSSCHGETGVALRLIISKEA